MTGTTDRMVKRYYDELRDAELNKEYYAARMTKVRKKLRNINIFLALFAGSSAVISFSLWNYNLFGIPVGGLSIGALTGAAIVLSIAKPYLGFEAELERLSSVQGVYSVMASLYRDVVSQIMTNRDVSEKEKNNFELMRSMRISIDPKEDKPADRDLVEEMQKVINKRFPEGYFWYPEHQDHMPKAPE